MKILITGACGWTAVAIIDALIQAGHSIVGFDLASVCDDSIKNKCTRFIKGSVSNYADIDEATKSIDAIIHLAISTQKNDYQSANVPFNVNVIGTYNVFEAARRNNVSKIILIGSAPVHLTLAKHKFNALKDWKSSADEDHLYDLTKRLQEEIAKDFCDTYAMNAIVLRSGHIVDSKTETDPSGRPLTEVKYASGGWVCRYDLANACVRALDTAISGYTAYHIIGSIQAKDSFDMERTEKELGLTFKAHFENFK
jgi:nucleoside-diphosphate-sugar epimerase